MFTVGVNYGGSIGPQRQTLTRPQFTGPVTVSTLKSYFNATTRWGINESYGWDFGEGFHRGMSGGYWRPAPLNQRCRGSLDVEQFYTAGATVVRWFILGDGTSYGDSNDFTNNSFDPPSKNSARVRKIIDDFHYLLNIFYSVGRGAIKIMPVVCDFYLSKPQRSSRPINSSGTTLVSSGRSSIFTSRRREFFDEFLTPLIRETNAHPNFRNVVYAWDLINEPDWVVTPYETGWLPVPYSDMLSFLQDGTQIIKAEHGKATIGFASYDSMALGLSSGGQRTQSSSSMALRCDVDQFHYYPAESVPYALPPRRFHPRSAPMIVGEFSARTFANQSMIADPYDPQLSNVSINIPMNNFRHWPGFMTNGLRARLRTMKLSGYDGAFLWHTSRCQRLSRKEIELIGPNRFLFHCSPNDFWDGPSTSSVGSDTSLWLDWMHMERETRTHSGPTGARDIQMDPSLLDVFLTTSNAISPPTQYLVRRDIVKDIESVTR